MEDTVQTQLVEYMATVLQPSSLLLEVQSPEMMTKGWASGPLASLIGVSSKKLRMSNHLVNFEAKV